jgi:hypothetical protein
MNGHRHRNIFALLTTCWFAIGSVAAAVTVHTERAAWRIASGGDRPNRIADDFATASFPDRGSFTLRGAIEVLNEEAMVTPEQSGSTELIFDQPVHAVGFDARSGFGAAGTFVTLRLDNGEPVVLGAALGTGTEFRGFVSSVPFSRLAFMAAIAGDG